MTYKQFKKFEQIPVKTGETEDECIAREALNKLLDVTPANQTELLLQYDAYMFYCNFASEMHHRCNEHGEKYNKYTHHLEKPRFEFTTPYWNAVCTICRMREDYDEH